MVIARLRTLALTAVLTLGIIVGAAGIGTSAAEASAPAASIKLTAPASVTAAGAGTVPMGPPIIDGGNASSGSNPNAQELNYLPVLRWAGATGKFHSRLNSSLFDTNLFERVQRDVVAALFMTIGDTIWSGTAGFTTQAIRLDVFSVIGAGIDRAAGSLGGAFIGNRGAASLVLLFVVGSVVAAVFSGRRRGMAGAWKSIGTKLAIVAVMAFMVAGATQSTGSGNSYRPGVGSPGWILTKTEQVVSTVASAPAAALTIPTDGLTAGNTRDAYSCAAYTDSLRDSYFTSSGGTRLTNASFVTPVVMSSLWEQTGLRAWKAAQFGLHDDNDYGDRVYCRLLEDFAGVPVAHQAARQNAVLRDHGKPNDAKRTSIAFRPITNQDRDASLVAWAACNGPDESRNADALTNPDEESGPGCAEWWSEPAGAGGFDTNHSRFDWEADPGFIDTQAGGAGAQDFLHSLHGDSVAPAGPAALAYLISAIAVFVVFGGVSLLVILAKVGLLFMALASMVVLVVSLVPGVDAGQKVGQFSKQALGLLFISAGAVLVFSFLAFLTQIVQSLGGSIFNASYIMQMLWVAVAPIAAAVIINWIFKKLLKMPSPFKPSSVMAYGAAAGGLGAAAGGMIGGRMGAMARGAQHAAGRKLMGAATSAVKSRMPAALRKGSMAADAVSGTTAKDKAEKGRSTQLSGDKAMAGAGAVGAGAAGAGAAGLKGAARRRAELLEERSASSKSKHAAESGSVATLLAERREASEVAKQLRDEQNADAFGAQLRARRAPDSDGNRQSLHRAVLGSARTALASNVGDRVATLKAHPLRSTGRTLAAVGHGGMSLAKTGAKVGVAAVGVAALGPMVLPAVGAYAAVKAAPRLAAALPGGSRDRSIIEAARVQHEAERERQQRPPAKGTTGPAVTPGTPEGGQGPLAREEADRQRHGVGGSEHRPPANNLTPAAPPPRQPADRPALSGGGAPPAPPPRQPVGQADAPPPPRVPRQPATPAPAAPAPAVDQRPRTAPTRQQPSVAAPAPRTARHNPTVVPPPASRGAIPGTAHNPGKEGTK